MIYVFRIQSINNSKHITCIPSVLLTIWFERKVSSDLWIADIEVDSFLHNGLGSVYVTFTKRGVYRLRPSIAIEDIPDLKIAHFRNLTTITSDHVKPNDKHIDTLLTWGEETILFEVK